MEKCQEVIKNNELEISLPRRNDKFELPDGA